MTCVFFFQAEDGIRDSVASRGLGDVYKRQGFYTNPNQYIPIEKTKTPDGSPIGDFSCDY